MPGGEPEAAPNRGYTGTGSVDKSVADGLMRYGLVDAAHRLIRGLVASAAFTQHRLPKLFSGIADDDEPFRVSYPTSCSP